MNYYEGQISDHTIGRVIRLPAGNEATLQELFAPHIWWEYSPGTRRALGRAFKRMVDRGEIPLKPLGTNAAHHQRYRKR